MTTAALVTAYTDAVGSGAMPPSPEEVLTTWPGPCGGDHAGDEGLDAVEDPPHVDGEGPFPVIGLVLPHPALGAGADARVVAEHVHGAEGLVGGVGQRDHGVAVADVDHPGEHLGPVRDEFAGGLAQGALLDVGEDHLHSLGGKAAGHGEADAAGGSGDHGHLSRFEPHVSPSP